MTQQTLSPDPRSPQDASDWIIGEPTDRRRIPPLAIGVALVVTALLATWVFARPGSSADLGYRTAVASRQSVAQTLDRVATVEPVSRATVSFPVSGTVASVGVAVGDTVTVGQAVASLDATSLNSTLVAERAALADAELALEKALAGESAGGSGDQPSGGSSDDAGSVSDDSTGQPSAALVTTTSAPVVQAVAASPPQSEPVRSEQSAGPGDQQVRAARQAIVDTQAAVTAAMGDAAAALDQARSVCSAVGSTGTASTSTTTQPSAPTSTTQPGAGNGSDGGAENSSSAVDSNAVADCQAATTAVLDAQSTVLTTQESLTDAVDAYGALVDQRAASSAGAAAGTTTVPDRSGTSGQDSSGPDTGQTGATSPDRTTATVSAADLIAAQKSVDAAEAAVAVAEQALAQATVVSPIDGTVVSVGMAVGDSVDAGSSTANVTVVGSGGYEVSTTVTVDDLRKVAVGQPVTIAVDGVGEPVEGRVVRIGVVPSADSTGSASTTYPVVVAITGPSSDLRNGATATASIVIADAGEALAVPVSAVQTDGRRSIVTVLADGVTTTEEVTVGAIGSSWVEIRSGLEPGATVVLADLSEALPGSATDGSSAQTGFRSGGPPGFGPPDGFEVGG